MKIAFLAMSGVRAQDPELMALGLTLPGFVERSRVIASLPSLGLLTLAGMTDRRRHSVHYFEAQDLRGGDVVAAGFDLVAISSLTAQIGTAYAIADRVRAGGAKVVLGGLHATALPEEALAHADAVVAGAGESCWPQVLADAEAGRLHGIHHGARFDLADAPMPAFELLEIGRYNRLTVQTARGCPWRCEFCASSVLLTPRYDQKPTAKVLAEVDRIRQLWPRPFLEFADDNSFVDRARWRELLPELARRGVRWFTETDLSIADDPEFLRQLRRSGCRQVLIGLESPDADGLDGLELRRNWKAARSHAAAQAVRTIQAHGIRVNACFILGLDGQGPEVFERVYDTVRTLAPFDVQITVQTPFPGTPLHRRLAREGRLLAPGAWERCTLFDVNFRPERMQPEELRQGLLDLTRRLYTDEFTRWRRLAWRRLARQRAAAAGPVPLAAPA
ncbi:MAG: B12-binding domain-containing radical SAM protein [Planctomycetes bacterium]|nr:B12-binding domain-containing radical SAM protein [Planctomycetota bacterium]